MQSLLHLLQRVQNLNPKPLMSKPHRLTCFPLSIVVRAHLHWVGCAFALALSAASLHATVYTWTGGGDDTLFSNPENWGQEAAYPGEGDTAIFDWTGNQTVTFDGNQTTAAIRFLGTKDGSTLPTLTLDLGGHTYVASSTNSTNIFFPSGSNSPRTVILQNGVMTIGGGQYYAHGGVAGANDGEIIVRIQQGATLNLSSSTYITWAGGGGSNLTGTFIVENGGTVNSGALLSVGNTTGPTGNIVVTGPGSIWNVNGTRSNWNKFRIGYGSSTGNVTISEGGRIDAVLEIGIGVGVRGIGTLTVTSGYFDEVESLFTSSHIKGNDIYIGGGSPDGSQTPVANGMGYASFIDGGTGEFTTLRSFFNENAYFDEDLGEWINTWGTLTINGGHVTVTGTATLDAGSVTELGINSIDQNLLMTVNNFVLDSTLQLIIDGNFIATADDEIHLIQYTSLTGTFAGLSEGATIHQDGYSFTIHYGMGLDGNIIGLTFVPEPGIASALVGALAALLAIRFRKRRG